jgi:hypothetical protein
LHLHRLYRVIAFDEGLDPPGPHDAANDLETKKGGTGPRDRDGTRDRGPRERGQGTGGRGKRRGVEEDTETETETGTRSLMKTMTMTTLNLRDVCEKAMEDGRWDDVTTGHEDAH